MYQKNKVQPFLIAQAKDELEKKQKYKTRNQKRGINL